MFANDCDPSFCGGPLSPGHFRSLSTGAAAPALLSFDHSNGLLCYGQAERRADPNVARWLAGERALSEDEEVREPAARGYLVEEYVARSAC